MTLTGNWNFPTPIRFGAGRISELADACRELGIENPLVVTDPALAKMPMVAEVVSVVEGAGLTTAVFSGIRANPVEQNVTDGVAVLRAGNHDGVIAMGGGSALDVAKAVALMKGQKRPLFDFEDVGDNCSRVDEAAMVPVVAVPTTSGTGSEVGRCSVITDERDHVKKIVFHPKMLPGRVVADPALTSGMPPGLTAAVGMDALGHNLEAYLAPGYHPMADGIALEAMRLVHDNLCAAFTDGADLEARSQMMAASTMGATSFQKGLGAIHALSHPVSATLDTHHGLAISTFMPYVLAANMQAVSDRVERLARYLGLTGSVMEWILALRGELGLPHSAAELGVTVEMVPELAAAALADPTLPTNPVIFDLGQLEKLYRCAIDGKLP